MNLFELFDKTQDEEREYYRAKKPVAVILTLLGLLAMCLCTPAGAAYLESWLLELMPFGATPAAWVIAIGFDLTFAYLLSHMFCDIFAGMNGRKTYWDIPTIMLVVLFGAITLCWSLWGGDMRKATASKEIAVNKSAVIDSAFTAVANIANTKHETIEAKKGMDRNDRKTNEAAAELATAQTEQAALLQTLAGQKTAIIGEEETHRHQIIENGKLIIMGAYLFLIITIGAVEYIKSRKESPGNDSKSDNESSESADNKPNSATDSKSQSIGFFGNSEGHILNKTIAFKKEDGTLKYYKYHQLTSMITDAKKKGNKDRELRLKILKNKLRPPKIKA